MTTLTIDTGLLIAAIKRVIPHTAKRDQRVPALECIRFFTRDSDLILTATDRYTVIESRIPLNEVDAATPVDFLVNATALKTILPALKPSRLTMVTPTGEPGAEFNSIPVIGSGNEFPRTASLWPDEFQPMPSTTVGLGVQHIKKLAALPQGSGERTTPMIFGCKDPSRDQSPIIILFGDHTRVLIMPVRHTIRDEQLSVWGMGAAREVEAAA